MKKLSIAIAAFTLLAICSNAQNVDIGTTNHTQNLEVACNIKSDTVILASLLRINQHVQLVLL